MLFDSKDNILTTIDTNEKTSDHLPIIGNIIDNPPVGTGGAAPAPAAPTLPALRPRQTQEKYYSIYLVPVDYAGPVKTYYRQWGGVQPHITLLNFTNKYDKDTMFQIMREVNGNGQKPWIYGKIRKDNITNDGKLVYLNFNTSTITKKLTDIKVSHKDLNIKTNTHITLGHSFSTDPSVQKTVEEID